MKLLFFLLLNCSFWFQLLAQEHYLVELENRSPDVSSMVQAYEGSKAIPFLANDVNGVEQGPMNHTGKTVLLWFWKEDCPKCIEQIADLNALSKKYSNDLQIISFSSNTKQEVLDFIKINQVEFPIIGNSEMLAEGPYGGKLGYPKFFMLDKQGTVKWVIPEVEMRGDFDTFNFFETLHVSLSK